MAIVKTADKKPQVYTDPETGKRKVRMVPVDKEIIKTDERKLTPAELKKREKVAKAIERENPNMPMDKKMAIATATAKKESVQLDEVVPALVGLAARGAASAAAGAAGSALAKKAATSVAKSAGKTLAKKAAKAAAIGAAGAAGAVATKKVLDKKTKKESVEEYRDPFKAAARSAKYKELSHEYEREKQVRRQKAQKSASQNKSFKSMRNRMEKVEVPNEDVKEGKKSSAQNQKILRIIGSAQNMDQAIKMVMKSHNTDEKKAKTLVHRAVKHAFYGEDAKKFAMADKGEYKKTNSKEVSKMSESVNELSKDLVKRYQDKAQDSRDSHKRISTDYATRTGDNKSDWTDKMAKVHKRAADNRTKGIARAQTKLNKEDVKEVSANLLRRYADKAGKQADTLGTKDQHPKAAKRAAGEYKAARKIMTKEANQPTGLIIHMKHKKTGKMVKSVHPGTHSAVRDAKAHIAGMQKKGYEVHKKELQF